MNTNELGQGAVDFAGATELISQLANQMFTALPMAEGSPAPMEAPGVLALGSPSGDHGRGWGNEAPSMTSPPTAPRVEAPTSYSYGPPTSPTGLNFGAVTGFMDTSVPLLPQAALPGGTPGVAYFLSEAQTALNSSHAPFRTNA